MHEKESMFSVSDKWFCETDLVISHFKHKSAVGFFSLLNFLKQIQQ